MRFSRFLFFVLLVSFCVGCAPQAAYFKFEAKDKESRNIDLQGKQVAIYPIAGSSKHDSIRVANAALGLATKLKEDRGMENALEVFPLPLFNFPELEQSGHIERETLKEIMFATGADLQIFLHTLRYGAHQMLSSAGIYGEYGQEILSLPYSVSVNVYDVLEDSLVFSTTLKDTVYMSLYAENGSNEKYRAILGQKIPEISYKVGETAGAMLSTQWNTMEWILVNYPDNDSWEVPLKNFLNNRRDLAIKGWMPLTESPNARKAAYAAYNIAIACEMMGERELAREWANFSVKKFRFKECTELVSYLNKRG